MKKDCIFLVSDFFSFLFLVRSESFFVGFGSNFFLESVGSPILNKLKQMKWKGQTQEQRLSLIGQNWWRHMNTREMMDSRMIHYTLKLDNERTKDRVRSKVIYRKAFILTKNVLFSFPLTCSHRGTIESCLGILSL